MKPGPKVRFAVAWSAGIASVVLACQMRDPTPEGRGKRIFARSCVGCHGADGRGTDRPGLTKPPRDLTNGEFQAGATNQQLRQSIRIGKGQMPSFASIMSDEDIGDVIAFVRTLAPPATIFPPGTPPVPGHPASSPPAAAAPAPSAANTANPPTAAVAPAERAGPPGAGR
jgi:cytochrome c